MGFSKQQKAVVYVYASNILQIEKIVRTLQIFIGLARHKAGFGGSTAGCGLSEEILTAPFGEISG